MLSCIHQPLDRDVIPHGRACRTLEAAAQLRLADIEGTADRIQRDRLGNVVVDVVQDAEDLRFVSGGIALRAGDEFDFAAQGR